MKALAPVSDSSCQRRTTVSAPNQTPSMPCQATLITSPFPRGRATRGIDRQVQPSWLIKIIKTGRGQVGRGAISVWTFSGWQTSDRGGNIDPLCDNRTAFGPDRATWKGRVRAGGGGWGSPQGTRFASLALWRKGGGVHACKTSAPQQLQRPTLVPSHLSLWDGVNKSLLPGFISSKRPRIISADKGNILLNDKPWESACLLHHFLLTRREWTQDGT